MLARRASHLGNQRDHRNVAPRVADEVPCTLIGVLVEIRELNEDNVWTKCGESRASGVRYRHIESGCRQHLGVRGSYVLITDCEKHDGSNRERIGASVEAVGVQHVVCDASTFIASQRRLSVRFPTDSAVSVIRCDRLKGLPPAAPSTGQLVCDSLLRVGV